MLPLKSAVSGRLEHNYVLASMGSSRQAVMLDGSMISAMHCSMLTLTVSTRINAKFRAWTNLGATGRAEPN